MVCVYDQKALDWLSGAISVVPPRSADVQPQEQASTAEIANPIDPEMVGSNTSQKAPSSVNFTPTHDHELSVPDPQQPEEVIENAETALRASLACTQSRSISVLSNVTMRDEPLPTSPEDSKPKSTQSKQAPATPLRDEVALAWLQGHDITNSGRAKHSKSPSKPAEGALTQITSPVHIKREPSMEAESLKLPSRVSTKDNSSHTSQKPLQLTADALLQARTANDFPFTKRKLSHSTWDISTNMTPRDVRHDIAPENRMMVINNMLSRRPYDLVEEDQHLNSAEFRQAFIRDWASNIRCQIVVQMNTQNVEAFCTRGIDPGTGDYLPPEEQPVCEWDEKAFFKTSQQERDHSEIWTSNFLIERERKIEEAKARRKNRVQGKNVSHFPKAEDHVPVVAPVPLLPELPSKYLLRPASWNDLQGIVDIYNTEVDRGLHAWDTEHVKTPDFNQIGGHCSENQLPFIVAVEHGPKQKDPEVIRGFGFLQLLDGGFGSGKHVGRLSARLSVFVDQQHRQNHIGSAIVDRILIHMSRGHPGTRVRHHWQGLNCHPYNDLENNRRDRLVLNRIIVESLFRGKRDPDWSWFDKMMTEFQFSLVGHVEGAYSTRRGMQSDILDKFVWNHDAQVPEPDGSDQALDSARQK